MFSSLFSFLIIAGLLLTGQTTAVSETPIPRETPIVTQSAPAPTIEVSLIEFKEMIDDEPAAGESPWIATGLSSENIVSAVVEEGMYETFVVTVTFDSAGKRLFTEVTTRNNWPTG